MPAKRRSVVISGAGDRRDDDIRQQTEILGDAFDDVVLYQGCLPARSRGRERSSPCSAKVWRMPADPADRCPHRRIPWPSDYALPARAGDLCLILIDQVEDRACLTSPDGSRRCSALVAAGRHRPARHSVAQFVLIQTVDVAFADPEHRCRLGPVSAMAKQRPAQVILLDLVQAGLVIECEITPHRRGGQPAGRSAPERMRPSRPARMTARSTRLRNSRTLPGQS